MIICKHCDRRYDEEEMRLLGNRKIDGKDFPIEMCCDCAEAVTVPVFKRGFESGQDCEKELILGKLKDMVNCQNFS